MPTKYECHAFKFDLNIDRISPGYLWERTKQSGLGPISIFGSGPPPTSQSWAHFQFQQEWKRILVNHYIVPDIGLLTLCNQLTFLWEKYETHPHQLIKCRTLPFYLPEANCPIFALLSVDVTINFASKNHEKRLKPIHITCFGVQVITRVYQKTLFFENE